MKNTYAAIICSLSLCYVSVLCFALVTGCETEREKTKLPSRPPLPPLPPKEVPSKGDVRGGEKSGFPPFTSDELSVVIIVEWSNAPAYFTDHTWRTGLEASTNLHDWIEITNLPYAEGWNRVALTNRGPAEFYRAFNSER